MTEHDLSKHYVYILLDTDYDDFYEVFCGVFATEESANEAADRICNFFYKDNPAHRHHFKVKKEEVKS